MNLGQRMAINFMYKIILFPTIIFGAGALLPSQIHYSSWIPPLLLSGFFILIGLFADETILPMFGNEKATIQGALFMTGATWVLPFLVPGNGVTLLGAAATGLSLGMVEYGMHGWLLKQRKTSL
ncbi:hypothetical protein [Ammoniphilus sp. YIM 78166]|uniref:hypothetical protein n=1 Tax=Ammoniphilus sp. YIM 78166 TaxID=1644106 RepID=UPI00106FB550|nr:hypothetical protein [Ammoniphilus sp. YIM 78166]